MTVEAVSVGQDPPLAGSGRPSGPRRRPPRARAGAGARRDGADSVGPDSPSAFPLPHQSAVRGVVASVVLVASLLPGLARGEDETPAVVLWDRAREARERGDLEEAERLLRDRAPADSSGMLACELAWVLVDRGRHASAVHWLERCAATGGIDPDLRARSEDAATALRLRSGALRLEGGSEGDRVVIDGELAGILPFDADLPLATGPHSIEVVAGSSGTVRLSRDFEVVGARVTRIDLDAVVDAPPPPPPRPRRVAPLWALWTALGLTVAAGVGFGVALWADINLSQDETASEADVAAAQISSAALGGLTGLAVAAVIILIPYVLAGRPVEPETAAFGPGLAGPGWLGLALEPAPSRWP